MTTFAWGLRPNSVPHGPMSTPTDTQWTDRIQEEKRTGSRQRRRQLRCVLPARVANVPRLLLRELVVTLARRMLRGGDSSVILLEPVTTVVRAATSTEDPPSLWMVSLRACFPCEGVPATRCLDVSALLDADDVRGSRVLRIEDVGVVPAEQADGDGVVPANALKGELLR